MLLLQLATHPQFATSFDCMASSSNSPAPSVDERRPVPVHWWNVPVTWCGGNDGREDVCIRLVRNLTTNEQVAGHSPLLALVAVHSGPLVTHCKFFRDMAERFVATPTWTMHQVTIHVDRDDIAPYIECFTIMYNPPPEAGSQLYEPSKAASTLQDLKYPLGLLGAASHIGYDALSASVSHHLTTMYWVSEHMLILAARGGMRKEGLVHLVTAYCHNCHEDCNMSAIVNLLIRGRDQDWSPTPTFEQAALEIIHEELKRLLAEAYNEFGGESGERALMDDGLPSSEQTKKICDMLKKVCDMLTALTKAQVAREGVKCLLQNSWIPKLLNQLPSRDPNLVALKSVIKRMVSSVYIEVGDSRVLLGNSERYELLKDWTSFMEPLRMQSRINHRGVVKGLWRDYVKAKKAIFASLPHNMQMDLLVMNADRGFFATFGSPEKLCHLLKDSMAPMDEP